jgi:hypothetical protein
MSFGKLIGIFVALVVTVIAGVLIYLGTADFPAPTSRQERVIPIDRLPR